jgi:hypothetical protein
VACTDAESTFNQYSNLEISINTQGAVPTVWLENVGGNVLQITRILVALTYPVGASTGTTVEYLRPPGQPNPWAYPSATLEQGTGATYYELSGWPAGTTVEAQAEYIEVQARSRSCAVTI